MLKILEFRKGDVERQLTLCLMGIMVLLLVPFSIYRLLTGDVIQFVVDLVMAMIAAFVFFQSWRHKKMKGLNHFAVLAFISVNTVLLTVKGMDMIFWLFPTIIGTYFLLASTPALIMNVLFIGVNTFLVFDKLTKNDITSIYPSLLLVCFFGYFLSKRSEYQNKKLFKLVSVDTLTGVKNRRSFDEKVEEILANHKRNPTSVSMLLLDLDNFKKINDSFGHKQGDQVLIDFAQKVKSMIRSTDFLYRFGGEEFVVIANNSGLENSVKLAESIREFIMQSTSLSKYKVTVSIGIAEILEDDNADSWFRRADRALYESKAAGRNKVTLAKFDERNEVFCEALNDSRKIKPISSKTHNFIRTQDDKTSNSLATSNQRTIKVLDIIDKV